MIERAPGYYFIRAFFIAVTCAAPGNFWDTGSPCSYNARGQKVTASHFMFAKNELMSQESKSVQ
jgi:hypothetical protein